MSHGFARPNMMGRLYLGMMYSGLAGDMFYVLELAEQILVPALRSAVSDLIAELPQLRTRPLRRWYGYRRALAAQRDVNLDDVLTATADPNAADRFFNHQRSPREFPIRMLLQQHAGGDRLLVAVHHSIADGEALGALIARLGEHYAAAVNGAGGSTHTKSAESESRYRALLALLTWSERREALRKAVRYVWSGVGLSASRPTALATFTDAPLPATGGLRYERLAISFDDASRLMRQAVRRTGSLTDMLLTASLRAAIRVWPDQTLRPIRISLPVNIRPAGDAGISNRVGVREFSVHAGAFDDMFAQISSATAQARALRPAIVDVFAWGLASCLPPAVFEHCARRYFQQSVNVRESLTFTTLGTFDGGFQRFGPAPVTDAFPVGSVIAPPGLRILMSSHRGRLNLCVAYLDPVIAPARISALIEAVRAELAVVA